MKRDATGSRIAILAIVIAVAGWSGSAGPPFPGLDIALLRQVAASAPDQNIVLSPYSLGMAAIPLLVGTTGGVQHEWAMLLQPAGAGRPGEIAADGAHLTDMLARNTELTFRSANALWAPPELPIRAGLADSLRKSFGVSIRTADLTTQRGIGAVNAWADSVTRGKIHALFGKPLSPGPANSVNFVLANAVYFFGPWAEPFEPDATRPRPFFRTATSVPLDVPTMSGEVHARTFHDASVEGVWLPYRGEALGLLVVMPVGKTPLPDFIARLPDDALQRWLQRLVPEKIKLELPRARVETSQPLLPALGKLGIRASQAYSHAPWVPIFGEGVFTTPVPMTAAILEVRQRTTFDLSEEGVEATAATAMSGRVMAPMPVQLRLVQINRPFLVAVVGPQDGTPLFVGQIVAP